MKPRPLLAIACLSVGSFAASAATINPITIGPLRSGLGDGLPLISQKVNDNFAAVNAELATTVKTTGPFTLGGVFTFSIAPVFGDTVGTRAALGLGSVSTHAASDFDASGAATAAQAAAVQRANHTGTQPATTITGLAAVAISGNYGDLSGKPVASNILSQYHISGLRAQTTGTITSGSVSLTVADGSTYSAGQYVFVLGAGPSGTNLVTRVVAISGNALTLQGAAGTSVSTTRVQHDDATNINVARQAAFDAKGGKLVLPRTGCDGYYRCNAPFQAATNSIIGIPPVFGDMGIYPKVWLEGEVTGSTNSDASAYYGCVIDATDCPSGTGVVPSVIGDAPYVALTVNNYAANLACIDTCLDNLEIVARANSGVSGINDANVARAEIGDGMVILSLSPTGLVQPTVSSVGVLMPRTLNNVESVLGGYIVGWGVGANVSELCKLNNPYININQVGMELVGIDYGPSGSGSHWITGQARIQNCNTVVNVLNPVNVRLDLSVEVGHQGTWYAPAAGNLCGWNDPANYAHGTVSYCSFNFSNTVDFPSCALPIVGASHVVFTDVRSNSTGTPVVPPALAQYNLSSLNDDQSGVYPLTSNNGTASFGSGHTGNCVTFNGSSYLTSTVDLSTKSFTIAFWVKLAANQQKYLLTQFDGVSINNRWQIYQAAADNSVQFAPIVNIATPPPVSTGPLNPGVWHFVAVAWNADTTISQISVDNQTPVASAPANQNMQSGGTAPLFSIGANSAGSLGTTSSIDSVRVFNRVLPISAITTLYAGGAGVE